MILMSIFVGLLIFFVISLLILGTEFVPELNNMGSGAIFFTFILFVFPIYLYGTYLCYLYLDVIKTERNKRNKELSREIDIDMEDVDTVDNQEQNQDLSLIHI